MNLEKKKGVRREGKPLSLIKEIGTPHIVLAGEGEEGGWGCVVCGKRGFGPARMDGPSGRGPNSLF